MRYGSICSGVEAASLAWRHLGWTPAFFSEVEPFPAAVLMQRLGAMKPLRPLDPDAASDEKDRKQRLSWQSLIAEMPDGGTIPNLGDFTLIKKDDYDGQIDLLVGGTPCQDLSIAGKRLGFGGKRSVLALDFVRLCFETGTRWVLWENVPAALSSRRGEDFGRFVSLLCGWNVPVPESGWRKCGIVTPAPGGFGVAWRVLDSQFTRPEMVTKKVLETIRAERPAANVNISVKTAPEGGELRKTIEAAMCLRVGVSADQLDLRGSPGKTCGAFRQRRDGRSFRVKMKPGWEFASGRAFYSIKIGIIKQEIN